MIKVTARASRMSDCDGSSNHICYECASRCFLGNNINTTIIITECDEFKKRDKVKEAIDKVFEELNALSKEELFEKLDEVDKNNPRFKFFKHLVDNDYLKRELQG